MSQGSDVRWQGWRVRSMVVIERENYLKKKEYPLPMESLAILRRLESILKNNKTATVT